MTVEFKKGKVTGVTYIVPAIIASKDTGMLFFSDITHTWRPLRKCFIAVAWLRSTFGLVIRW